jgi:hypothetical protein
MTAVSASVPYKMRICAGGSVGSVALAIILHPFVLALPAQPAEIQIWMPCFDRNPPDVRVGGSWLIKRPSHGDSTPALSTSVDPGHEPGLESTQHGSSRRGQYLLIQYQE